MLSATKFKRVVVQRSAYNKLRESALMSNTLENSALVSLIVFSLAPRWELQEALLPSGMATCLMEF
jgi:hypothetical protein